MALRLPQRFAHVDSVFTHILAQCTIAPSCDRWLRQSCQSLAVRWGESPCRGWSNRCPFIVPSLLASLLALSPCPLAPFLLGPLLQLTLTPFVYVYFYIACSFAARDPVRPLRLGARRRVVAHACDGDCHHCKLLTGTLLCSFDALGRQRASVELFGRKMGS